VFKNLSLFFPGFFFLELYLVIRDGSGGGPLVLDVLQCVGIVGVDRFGPVGVLSVTDLHIRQIGFDQRDQTGQIFNCDLKKI